MNKPFPILCCLLTGFLSVSGCASLPNTVEERIDNRRVEYALTEGGPATVVFENGLGARMDWWEKVLPELAGQTTTLAYNRAGYGSSDSVSGTRDGQRIVDELRQLLLSKNLPPPYVLVGHSLGGLYMQLFARRYPGEVGALILVDSTHPRQLEGDGAYDNWPTWLQVLFELAISSEAQREFDAINATGDEVMALPTVSNKPVIVLSALQPTEESSTLADDANAKRRDLVRLYPGAKQIWVDSGHAIPLEKPDAVVSAIREALNWRQ